MAPLSGSVTHVVVHYPPEAPHVSLGSLCSLVTFRASSNLYASLLNKSDRNSFSTVPIHTCCLFAAEDNNSVNVEISLEHNFPL